MNLGLCNECKSRNLSKDESRGEVVCDDCGLVLEENMHDHGTKTEGAPVKQASQTKTKRQEEVLEDDIRAFIFDPEKREFSDKQKKKRAKRIRALVAQSKKEGSKADMSASGWESIPEWKWDADSKKLLNDTRLDNLGETFVKLESSMRETIQGADIPDRGVYRFEKTTKEPTRIVTPKKVVSAIEFFIKKTHEHKAYWFLHDFSELFPVNIESVSELLDSPAPLSSHSAYLLGLIHEETILTNDAMRGFIVRVGKRLEFDTNGLENDNNLPLPFEGGTIPESIKKKISLCPIGTATPSKIHSWVEFSGEKRVIQLGETKRLATLGVLRPSPHHLLLTHIPLAYAVAQRIFDVLRADDQWRNNAMKILNMIEGELSWCPATVEEMDGWWAEEIKKNASVGDVSVTTLRRSPQ